MKKNMLTRSFWYFQQLIKTDCLYNKSHGTPFLIQAWSEKGKVSGFTRTPKTVLGWHLPTLAGQRGAWLVVANIFPRKKEIQSYRC